MGVMQNLPLIKPRFLRGIVAPSIVLLCLIFLGTCLVTTQFHLREIAAYEEVFYFLNSGYVFAFSEFIAVAFSPVYAVLITLTSASFLAWKRGFLLSAYFASVTFSGWLGAALVKPVVSRPRPNPTDFAEYFTPVANSLSFPSGHTAFAAGLFLALLLVLAPQRLWRLGFGFAVALIAVVGTTRVVVGAHFPTDVLAGGVAGICGVLICASAWALFAQRSQVA